ncbi:MAG TPA: DNA-directed RNA polymerase subunit N [Saprospiraceae bacterium]|nr:DNA-directed RNA polymerase subunit N [Saprospiraceae bacterium]
MATFPIRCFTCGKVINHMYKKYKERRDKNEEARVILDEFNLTRMCCRRMFISHATDKLEEYQLMYPTHATRVIKVGSKATSFADSRAKVKAIIDED